MKTNRSSFILCRSLGAISLLAGALSSTASAEVIAGWDLEQQTYAPWLVSDHQTTTPFVNTPGLTFSFNSLITSGWQATRNSSLFTSFTVKPEAGFALSLTSLNSDPIGNGTGISWGYRIDDGSGYGAWTFSPDYSVGTTGGVFQPWDFDDFTTTGTVQFGFFATGNGSLATPGSDTSGYEIELDGAVVAAPVPEPTSLTLAALSALGVVAGYRRRTARIAA